jgi:hypothetical protein
VCVHAEIKHNSKEKKKAKKKGLQPMHTKRRKRGKQRGGVMKNKIKLTLHKLQVRSGHDEHHSALFGLPPLFLRSIDDGQNVALVEGELVGVIAGVAVCGFCFL